MLDSEYKRGKKSNGPLLKTHIEIRPKYAALVTWLYVHDTMPKNSFPTMVSTALHGSSKVHKRTENDRS